MNIEEKQKTEIRDLLKLIITAIPAIEKYVEDGVYFMDDKYIREMTSQMRDWMSNTTLKEPLLADVHQLIFNLNPYESLKHLFDPKVARYNAQMYGTRQIRAVFKAFENWEPKEEPVAPINPDIARAEARRNEPQIKLTKREPTEKDRLEAIAERERCERDAEIEKNRREKEMARAIEELKT